MALFPAPIPRIYAVFIISDYVRGYTGGGLCYMLSGIVMTVFVILMILLQPYKSRKVNNYHIVLMLNVTLISFLAVVVVQSKVCWILNTGAILIAILSHSPLLIIIAYGIIYRTPCRRFKQCWPKFPMHNEGNPELDSLLEINNRE